MGSKRWILYVGVGLTLAIGTLEAAEMWVNQSPNSAENDRYRKEHLWVSWKIVVMISHEGDSLHTIICFAIICHS